MISAARLLRVVLFVVGILVVAGCTRSEQAAPTTTSVTIPGGPVGLETGEIVVELPVVAADDGDGVGKQLPGAHDQVIAAATPPEFCTDVVRFSDILTGFRSLIDDKPGHQPFTVEAAASLHQLSQLAQSLADQQTAIQEEAARPHFDEYLFAGIALHERLVRQANFGPESFEIPSLPHDAKDDYNARFRFIVTKYCPTTKLTAIVLLDYADLPGPRQAEAMPSDEVELCPTAHRYLSARRWAHEQAAAHIDGDPYALTDARGYFDIAGSFAYQQLRPALRREVPQVSDDLRIGSVWGGDAVADVLRQYEYHDDRDEVIEYQEAEHQFFEVLQAACPDLDPTLVATGTTVQLFDLALELIEGPRPADDVGVTCHYAGFRLEARSEFRDAVAANNIVLAGDVIDKLKHHEDIYDPDLVWLTGFEPTWISMLHGQEFELYLRAKHESPITPNLDATQQIEALLDWTRTNCPHAVVADLPHVTDVFDQADPGDVNAHQQQYCNAAQAFGDARVDFRNQLDGADNDAGIKAYRTLVNTQRVLSDLSDNKLLLDPEGEFTSNSPQGASELFLENRLRQAALADPPIAIGLHPSQSTSSYDALADVVQRLCTFQLADVESFPLIVERLGLPSYDETADVSEINEYCRTLEIALTAHTHFVELAREVGDGDPGPRWDALAFYQRSRPYVSPSPYSSGGLFFGLTVLGDRRLLPDASPSYYLHRALTDDDFDLASEDFARALERQELLAPQAREACPSISDSIADIWVDDALALATRIDAALAE